MENTPLIYKKINEVMVDVNAISKDRRNQQQGFQFRGIDDVMNELHSSLSKCGVFVLPEVLEESRTTGKSRSGGDMFHTRLKISFGFYAEDGSHVDAVVIGEAMDSGDKASNKAMSVGLKYALLQVFCIPTEDEKDPDAQSPEPQAGRMKTETKAPAKKAPAKLAFEPKGGETTPEEKKELGNILASKDANGKPIFTRDEMKKYSDMRKDYTAREVIDIIKKDLIAKLNPPLPKEVEAVKNAVDGEVVNPPEQFDIY